MLDPYIDNPRFLMGYHQLSNAGLVHELLHKLLFNLCHQLRCNCPKPETVEEYNLMAMAAIGALPGHWGASLQSADPVGLGNLSPHMGW